MTIREEKFQCRKCNLPIGGHNQYLHDGMCDDCFFEMYFPEEALIVETDLEQKDEFLIDISLPELKKMY